MARGKMMVAREDIVVVVGAEPPTYGEVELVHNKTGEKVTRTETTIVLDEGKPGVSYAFKAFQKVPSSHPAVKDCPGGFMPLDDVDEMVAAANGLS